MDTPRTLRLLGNPAELVFVSDTLFAQSRFSVESELFVRAKEDEKRLHAAAGRGDPGWTAKRDSLVDLMLDDSRGG
jgi:hypothetical protein